MHMKKIATAPFIGALLAAAMANAAPAATTAPMPTLSTVASKVSAKAPLTDTDKAAFSAAVRTQSPNATDADLATIFNEYAKGNTVPLTQTVVSSDITVEHRKIAHGLTGGAQTASLDPVCPANENWVRINRNGYNVFGWILTSFHMEKDWWDNCQGIMPAYDATLTYNITGNGAALGWHFNNYTTVQNYYFKYNGSMSSGHRSFAQADFSGCPYRIGCTVTWQPWIQIDGRAGPGPDTAWRTDDENYVHYID